MELLHGGNIYDSGLERRREKGTGRLLDFSANINPLGMPKGVKQAVICALEQAEHYPDPLCRRLKSALSEYHGLPEAYFICGNGGADLIYRLVYALRPKKALLTAPTFAEYEEALKQRDTELCFYQMGRELQADADILEQMDESLDLMFLCNPNNPTGLLFPEALLLQILKKAERCGIFLAVDECFLDFTGQEERSLLSYIKAYKNLLVLRSFTKLYAMPGIRLGYGICGDQGVLDRMAAAGQCWGVSVLASEAGIAALKEETYKSRSVAFVREERRFLKEALEALKLVVWDGQADYLLFRAQGVTDLYERLLPYGILIRRCGNYRGLWPDAYRAAVKDHEANTALLEALKEVLPQAL